MNCSKKREGNIQKKVANANADVIKRAMIKQLPGGFKESYDYLGFGDFMKFDIKGRFIGGTQKFNKEAQNYESDFSDFDYFSGMEDE